MSSLVERFAQNAENKGSLGYGYFKLDIGSSAVLRFLSPMVDNVMVNHASVGCSCNIEIPQDMWNRTKEQTGQNPVCPICQRPFADTDVITVKEGVRGGGFHYIPNGGYVLCLDDIDNNQPYACPLCQTQVEKTKRDGTKYMGANVPQDRMCAYAVIRKVNRERGTDGRGMPVEQIVSIEDEMVERNGAMVPNVVIVDQAYSNFWAQLTSKDDDFCDPITYYDYEVYRSDMRTYVVTKIQRPDRRFLLIHRLAAFQIIVRRQNRIIDGRAQLDTAYDNVTNENHRVSDDVRYRHIDENRDLNRNHDKERNNQ